MQCKAEVNPVQRIKDRIRRGPVAPGVASGNCMLLTPTCTGCHGVGDTIAVHGFMVRTRTLPAVQCCAGNHTYGQTDDVHVLNRWM